MRVEQGFLAIHGLLVWVRVLKYFTLIPCFQVHVRVLERCVVSLLQFLCVFLFIIRGFSIAFYLGFGGDYDLFESISSATFSLIFASAVGLNFEPIFAKGLIIGEVIFFLYLAIVWFFYPQYLHGNACRCLLYIQIRTRTTPRAQSEFGGHADDSLHLDLLQRLEGRQARRSRA